MIWIFTRRLNIFDAAFIVAAFHVGAHFGLIWALGLWLIGSVISVLMEDRLGLIP